MYSFLEYINLTRPVSDANRLIFNLHHGHMLDGLLGFTTRAILIYFQDRQPQYSQTYSNMISGEFCGMSFMFGYPPPSLKKKKKITKSFFEKSIIN